MGKISSNFVQIMIWFFNIIRLYLTKQLKTRKTPDHLLLLPSPSILYVTFCLSTICSGLLIEEYTSVLTPEVDGDASRSLTDPYRLFTIAPASNRKENNVPVTVILVILLHIFYTFESFTRFQKHAYGSVFQLFTLQSCTHYLFDFQFNFLINVTNSMQIHSNTIRHYY